MHGDGEGIRKAGATLAGFSMSRLAGERRTRTAGRNQQISSLLLLLMAGPPEFKGDDGEDATDSAGIRKSVEALMPCRNSHASPAQRSRRQGYFEQARIRDWVADEHSTVEDGNEFVAAHTLCARVTAACADSRRNAELAQRAGQAMFPLLSNMSSHPSYPKLGGLIVTLAVTLLTMVLSAITPIRLATFFWLAGTVAAMLLVPWVLSGLLSANAKAMLNDDNSTRMYFRVPPHYKFACLGLLAYCSLMLLPIPSWLWIVPLAFTVAAGIRWWRNTLWDDILQRPRRYWWLRRKRKANLQ